MLVPRFVRHHELYDLHFLELMLTNQAARVFSVRTRLAAKTRRVRGVETRQRIGVERFVAMKIRHRHFRGRNQVVIAIGQLEQILLKLRKLPRAAKRFGVDDVRRYDFAISARGVLIEKEVDERTIEARAGAGDERESRAGDFRAAIEVVNAERLADVPVRLRLEIE